MPSSHDKRARLHEACDFLVDAAGRRQIVYYGDLAAAVSGPGYNPLPQSMGHFLRPITEFCDRENLPRLNDIVVAKTKKKPSYESTAYNYIASQERVFAFDWSKVKFNPDDLDV